MMGFTFAGIHSEQHGLRVLDVKRPISPGIAAKTVKVPGKVGVYDMGNEVDALHISVEVLLTGQTLREIRDRVRAVAAWLRNDDQTGMLTFDDEPDKAYTARLTDQTELEEMALTGQGTLTFLAADPLAYAVEDDVFTSESGVLSFQRKGTAPSQPLIEITGESSGMDGGFEVGLNGSMMTYKGPLGFGERLVIDSRLKTAYLLKTDGTKQSALNAFDSLTFPLTLPGKENRLQVSPLGAATIAQVKITCRSCWY
jgi:predicted phage tail component-like protein